AQRRADAPRRAGRAAGPQTTRADPRRAAGRSGRRQRPRPAAAARATAPHRGPDRRGHLARLHRARGAVPAHAASGERHPGVHPDDDGGPGMSQRRAVVLLRPVPGDSVVHRLWAGTKLLVVAAIGVLLTFYPGWVP